jgi:hypothetical protein
MWFRDLDRASATAVAAGMREWDRREIFATRFSDDIEDFVDDVMASGPLAWVSGLGDEPIAVFGCRELWKGVWSMWLFATDSLDKIGLSMTKLIVRVIVPSIKSFGAHRMECRSMEGHEDAQRWLKVIGANLESTLKGYGREGQNFHVFTWEIA